jgi:PAS domain S-box-containing protein
VYRRSLLTPAFETLPRSLTWTACVLVLLIGLMALIACREYRRRRRAEAALSGVSTLQMAILNAANYAIISTSVDGIVTSFNSTAERWLGYAAAEILGKTAPDIWHDPDEMRQRSNALSAEMGYPVTVGFDTLVMKARQGQREESEWTMIRKDSSRFPVWLSVTAVLDITGRTVGYVRVITDITKRKKHDAELRLSEERFRRAFDDAPIGMALVGLEGRWLKVNHALCEMIGYTEEELLATTLRSITHRDDLEVELKVLQEMLVGKFPTYQLEQRYLHRDGSFVYVMLIVSLVRDASGTPVYFVKQIENVTRRKEIDRIKNEFIATVSHELRTPLTSIRGSLGLIEGGALGKLPEKAGAMLKIAYQNCERLVRIINDILDAEKIQSGGAGLHLRSVPVTAVLKQALAVNEGYGAKYAVRFVLEGTPAYKAFLADADRLMQVMANLLSNAAKFSPHGAEVVVRASVRGARVRVEVEDHGTGIPEEFRGRIFDKFAQADSSNSRRFEGTGLGLSITRQLVEAMGGTIGFQSTIGQGTIFYFELPQADHAPTSAPLADLEATPSRYNDLCAPAKGETLPRVLHAEDDKDLGNFIDVALAGKADVTTARTIQAAELLLSEKTFSLLILDLGLPDGDGLDLLLLPAFADRSMPVVILSATEPTREVQERVTIALVKSRVSEAHIIQTILSLLPKALN